jgi:hypothetical protein
MKLLNKNKEILVWVRGYTIKTTWKPYTVRVPSYRITSHYIYNKHLFHYNAAPLVCISDYARPKNYIKNDPFIYRTRYYVESTNHEPLELLSRYNKKRKGAKRHSCLFSYTCDGVRCIHISSPYKW